MDVLLSEIPEEGLHLEGELPASIFDLAPDDPIRPAGRVRYEATLHLFDEVIAVHGRLRGPFQLQCGACLEYFDYEADYPDWGAEVDREPGRTHLDLAELVREEFLLLLPSHPRCDEYVEGRVCPKAEEVDRLLDDEVPGAGGAAPRNAWGALDDWKQ